MSSLFVGKYKPAIILTLALAVFLASCKPPTTTPGTTTPDPTPDPTPDKSWVVTTLAGSDADARTPAGFNYPTGVAVDSSGILYVADSGNHRILKITISTGDITVLAGGGNRGGAALGYVNATGTAARFRFPTSVAVVESGGEVYVYVADHYNHCIRKIITSRGNVTTFAGAEPTSAGSGTRGDDNGAGTVARFNLPYGVAVDSDGNLYVADSNNHRIRKITSGGDVTIFAGIAENPPGKTNTSGFANGPGKAAQFDYPEGVAVDSSGILYVADYYNHCIRKIITSTGNVTTFAGAEPTSAGNGTRGDDNGAGTAARFNLPSGVAVDSSGNLYVADSENERIRKITPEGTVSTLAGSTWGHKDATGEAAQFRHPTGVAVDSSGNLYVADAWNHRIRKIEYK